MIKRHLLTKRFYRDAVQISKDKEFFKLQNSVEKSKSLKEYDVDCLIKLKFDDFLSELSPEEFIGYLRGNSLKYRWRFRYKNGIEDLKKAEWYENRLLKTLNKLDNQ